MDPKILLKNRYSAGLSMILAAAVLNLVCQAFYLLDIWKYLPFPMQFLSLWLPYSALEYVSSVTFGAVKWVCAAVLVLLPVTVLTHLRSRAQKEDYRYLIIIFAVIGADTLYIIADLIFGLTGYSGLPLCLVYHVICVCRYSRQYARDHRAVKTIWIPAVIVMFIAIFAVDIILCMNYLDMTLRIGGGLPIILFMVILAADVVLLVVMLFRISVFTEAGKTTYIIKPYGQIVRSKPFEPKPYDTVYYIAPQLVSEKKDRWIISYTYKGRRRKAVIPKAFPRMADYFARSN